MQRRQYLAAVGIATSSALAGCGSDTGSNGTGGGGGETQANGGAATEASTPANGGQATETVSESDDTVAAGTEPSTATAAETAAGGAPITEASTLTPSGGGGTGSTSVSGSELVVEEGQYSTDVYMTGIVENTGSDVLRLPEVRVSFYDESDSILETTTVSIVFLPSGTSWEIHELYFGEGEAARGEIEVTSADTFQTELGVPDSLNIAEENLQTGEEPLLSFRIENTSNNPVAPSAFCVFYDGEGVVLGDGLDSLEELPPGESWQSTLDFLAYSTQDATRVSDYELYANTY